MTHRLAKRLLLPVSLMLVLSACSIELQHSLSEQDANDIYVLLNENGIDVKKEKEEGGNEPTYKITVAKKDASQAAKLLREYSLPRPQAGGFNQISKGKGMIPTAVEERAMFLEAVAGEVTNALNKVDGVLEARVIVQIPEKNDLAQPEKKPLPTASAFVKFRTGDDGAPPLKEGQVKQFVATAVEDLKPENVTVIMSESHGPGGGKSDPSMQLQDILGLRMTAASAGQFKTMVALAGVLMLAMAGFTGWTFVRGGSSSKPRRNRGDA